MTQHQHCLICGSTNLRKFGKYLNGNMVECGNCHFHFALSIPTVAELIKHYEGYARNDYLSPVTIKRYNELLDTFESFRKTNRLLDVGSGIGYFLEQAKKRGWEVYGTEFTDEAMAICNKKGFKMQQGALDVANYDPASFDIITSFEVLEHINNPNDEIAQFNTLLRSGGLLYFTTPNFNAAERYYLKEKYDVIVYPEHLSYYTKSTMNRLLTAKGFKKKSLVTHGISFTRIQTSQSKGEAKYVEQNNMDDKLRSMMEEKIWAKWAKTIINTTLNFLSIGNSLKGYYIKK